MNRFSFLVPSTALLLSNAPEAPPSRPLRAPAQFVTALHGLTFRSPAGSTYCPLPSDWSGSDHGTVLFLTRPVRCGGAGYPSSSRSWDGPARSRIEVYYAYWMGEDAPPPKPCHRIGTVRLLGKARPLCRRKDRDMVVIEASARYKADQESELVLTLATTPKRLTADLATFRVMAASARPCRGPVYSIDENGRDVGKPYMLGTGAPCPAAGRYF